MDGSPRGQVFGSWDAPATDDDIPIDPPIGAKCKHCQEPIIETDAGRITPQGYVEHRECSLRSVFGGIGHHVDHERYCHGPLGPDAGLSYRTSALLTWNWYQLTQIAGVEMNEEQIEWWRSVLRLVAEGQIDP